jgi:hypothetical protein
VTLTDISSAFLNAKLAEGDLFAVEPPPEYQNMTRDTVWVLEKALYGLRGAPKYWQDHLVGFLVKQGFDRLTSDSAVFVLRSGNQPKLIVVAHVDDLSIVGDLSDRLKLIEALKGEFTLKHCTHVEREGDEAVFVGKKLVKVKGGFAVRTVREYVEKLVKELGLGRAAAKPAATPGGVSALLPNEAEFLCAEEHSLFRRHVGQLLWLSSERPDVQFAVKRLSQVLTAPTVADLQSLKRLGRYLLGTIETELLYVMPAGSSAAEEVPLEIFVDSDWAGCKATRRSTSGGLVRVGGCLMASWSRVQASVACSSAEAEYYAACTGAAEGLYVHTVAVEIGLNVSKPLVWTDASAAKAMAERNQMPNKVKHMQLRYLHLQNLVRTKRISIQKVGTLWNVADLLTKYVNVEALQRLRPLLNMTVLESTSKARLAQCNSLSVTVEDDLEEEMVLSPFAVGSSILGRRERDCSATLLVTMSLSMIVQAVSVPVEAGTNEESNKTWMDYTMFAVLVLALFGVHQLIDIAKAGLRATAVARSAAPAAQPTTTRSTIRTVATQSMVTYTAVRHHATPRFHVLREDEQGAYSEVGLRLS